MSPNRKRVTAWLKVRELDEFEVVFDPSTEIYGVRKQGDSDIMAFDSAVKANMHCLMLHQRVVDARNQRMYFDWHTIVMEEGLAD